jgi:uncharacterized membrane protein YfcA
MTTFEIVLILVGSFFGGFVNAIAGGGGLVSLPVMLSVFPDAPLPSIFGTTKSAMVWGTAWAARSYAVTRFGIVATFGASTCDGSLLADSSVPGF